MRIDDLGQLTPGRTRTVVINVGTDLVATRAVLSAQRHGRGPVLLVNCAPTEAGTRWADRLAARGVDVVDQPLRNHGDALDHLFRTLGDERLLLLDSDAEIHDGRMIAWMEHQVDKEGVFGAGFTQGPNRIPDHWSPPAGFVLHMERPWIPCTLLAAGPVREALAAGRSFNPRFVPNDAGTGRRLSNFLAARWGPPWAPHSKKFNALPAAVRRRARGWDLEALASFRDRYYFRLRPNLVFYDTGAEVYEHLRIERGLLFAGLPLEVMEGEIHHYSGVSRWVLAGPSVDDVAPEDIAGEVVERLRVDYGFLWDQ